MQHQQRRHPNFNQRQQQGRMQQQNPNMPMQGGMGPPMGGMGGGMGGQMPAHIQKQMQMQMERMQQMLKQRIEMMKNCTHPKFKHAKGWQTLKGCLQCRRLFYKVSKILLFLIFFEFFFDFFVGSGVYEEYAVYVETPRDVL